MRDMNMQLLLGQAEESLEVNREMHRDMTTMYDAAQIAHSVRMQNEDLTDAEKSETDLILLGMHRELGSLAALIKQKEDVVTKSAHYYDLITHMESVVNDGGKPEDVMSKEEAIDMIMDLKSDVAKVTERQEELMELVESNNRKRQGFLERHRPR